MKVYKFGGASVNDAAGIRNLAAIVSKEESELIIVASAFGKTTNALELLLKSWLNGEYDFNERLENIYSYHSAILNELGLKEDIAKSLTDTSFGNLKHYLSSAEKAGYDYEYDQVVSFGEVWSTIIISGFLIKSGFPAEWIDIKSILITDDRYRDANILWDESTLRVRNRIDFRRERIVVTQGFTGGTVNGQATTLGREGSDYTAAVLANILDAESVTVWKDVPGLLNADPKWLPDAQKLDEVSYREAVEMTFSGAKVIHPKTIKPLQNKNIPLFVKSFLDPAGAGTTVNANPRLTRILPVFVRKENQVLFSLLPRDFSFVMGENLSSIFHLFMGHGIKVNLVEASAVSIDVCVDDEKPEIDMMLSDLKPDYSAIYNDNVELLSIRHYTSEAIERITKGREILLEQRTRSTVRFVVKI